MGAWTCDEIDQENLVFQLNHLTIAMLLTFSACIYTKFEHWDLSFLSYSPDKQSDRQTDRQRERENLFAKKHNTIENNIQWQTARGNILTPSKLAA